jgi:GH25 family lysozyme M1 (1,4-beta-N-acetylmuramidase)
VEELKKLTVDGDGGEKTVIATQRFFKTFEDGIISGQNESLRKYYPALTAVMFTANGKSTVVKELQSWLGVTRDGVIGQETTKAWQKKLRSLGYLDKDETIDGIFGPKSMKAWQRFLNDQLFPEEGGKDPQPKTEKKGNIVIDVSYVQKSVTWSKVKAAGIRGAIIRCGFRGYESGKLQEDNMFMSHIKGAHKAGLEIGVYFFTEAISAKEGKEEAAYAIKLIKKAGIPINYPIAVDTEYINAKNVRANGLSKKKRTEVIKAFCEEIKRQGYTPMIYGSTSWLNNQLDMSKLPYKVWCAQYYKECQYKGDYIFWQYTSEGKIDGIKGVVDLNKCYI